MRALYEKGQEDVEDSGPEQSCSLCPVSVTRGLEGPGGSNRSIFPHLSSWRGTGGKSESRKVLPGKFSLAKCFLVGDQLLPGVREGS